MTHAWLLTGPPGSGRSTLAYAFAAALIAEHEGDEATMRQVIAGTHPDLTALRTEGVIISIKDARALVERSYFAPAVGRHRVIVVEDADRMTERTSNVLLKALEEPPERTVWVLCAPSEADLLPDHPLAGARSAPARAGHRRRRAAHRRAHGRRHRGRRAVRPARAAAHRHGTAPRHRSRVAGPARRHAPRRAAGEGRRRRRRRRRAHRRRRHRRREGPDRRARRGRACRRCCAPSGVAEGAAVPPAVRSQLSALEDEQKRRATRSLRDGIDRVLTDLQSMFRDVVLLQFGRDGDLINRELRPELQALADAWTPERTLVVLDHLADTRLALEQNVAPTLALESWLVTVTSGRTP